MRLLWAFLRRDAAIAYSYRTAFFAQFIGNVVLLAMLYFVGKTLGPRALPSLARYGGNFLAFLLIGVALTDCVSVSLVSFAQQVREGQTTGTLEATLISPVRLSAILIYSSLWSYLLSAIRFVLYLLVGAVLYGVNLGQANLFAALVIFILTVISFMGLGILWAGIVLVIKRGEAIMGTAGVTMLMLGGVVFPTSVLPHWIQSISALVPLTPALEAMRFALLRGYSLQQLSGTMLTLCVFAAVLLTAGIIGFNLAVQLGRTTGSLAEY